MKIIGFVGLPGSGKGEASQIARQQGLAVVVMGDIIRQEAARQGLEPTDQNLGSIGNALRAREGPDAVAKITFEMALASKKNVVVVDGLRSWEEADFFRTHADEFYLVEISAPARDRLKWLAARGRSDDPDSFAVASLEQRECREMGWGMREAMKTADLKLRNDGNLDDFRENAKRLLGLLVAGTVSCNEEQL